MGGKPSLPGAACSALGGSGGAPRVVLLGRGSSFPLPPRKARDTHGVGYEPTLLERVGSLSSRSGVRGSCASGEADAQPSPTVAVRPSPRLSAGFISRAGCISLPVASTRATD